MKQQAEAFFVTRTMAAMELLAFQSASAPQVAGTLGVHPGTARRLLNRLAIEGWLARSGGFHRTYTPTLRVVAMAAHLADRDALPTAARPVVGRLRDDTGGTVHLCIPSYRSVLCLVHAAGEGATRPRLRELVPAHASASGKVLLAHREAWRASVLASPLPALTPRTRTAPGAIESEAETIRERGYAVDDEELQPGVRAVAAPVRGLDGTVVAALALSGPARDLPEDIVAGVAATLIKRADEVRGALVRGDAR